MFCASEEQVEIRRKARGLYDSGICLIGEWCRKIPALTVQKWKLWERTDGFMDWWTELFPEHEWFASPEENNGWTQEWN